MWNLYFLIWSEKYFIVTRTANGYDPKFTISISGQCNAKLFHQLKTGFKETTDCNKYQ